MLAPMCRLPETLLRQSMFYKSGLHWVTFCKQSGQDDLATINRVTFTECVQNKVQRCSVKCDCKESVWCGCGAGCFNAEQTLY